MNSKIPELQEKYRFIRKRFKENFIAIGEGPGMSLPYHIHLNNLYWGQYRAYYTPQNGYDGYYGKIAALADQNHGYGQSAVPHFNQEVGCTNGYVMQFGDTTVRVGEYLVVLATEYSLMETTSTPNSAYLSELKDEIYYALKALVRMDKHAHEVFGRTSDGYQGYAFRDDAPVDFFKVAPKTGPNGTGLLANDLGGVEGDYITPSQWGNYQDYVSTFGVFVSQDQIFYISLGLSYIIKLIGDSVVSSKSSTPLKVMAEKLLRGYVSRCKNTGWIVTAPDGTLNTAGGDMRGSGFGYPFLLLCESILGETFADGATRAALRLTWDIIAPISTLSINNRKLVMLLNTFVHDDFRQDMRIEDLTHDNTQRDILALFQSFFHKEKLPNRSEALLYEKLGEKLLSCPNNPGTNGAGNVGAQGVESVEGWRSGGRWIHNGISELNDLFWGGRPTAHNGLDYLIAYNLYHLYFHPDTEYKPHSQGVANDRPKYSSSKTIAGGVKDNIHYSNHNNRVYYRGTDNKMYYVEQVNGQWNNRLFSNVNNVGDTIFYQLDRGKIYYVGTDRKLYNFYYHSGAWRHACLDNSITNIKEIIFYPKSARFYYIKDDSRIYNVYYSNGWKNFCLNWGVDNVVSHLIRVEKKIFYKGTDNALWQLSYENGQWNHAQTDTGAKNIKDNLSYSALQGKFIYRTLDNKLGMIYWNNGWHHSIPNPNGRPVGDTILTSGDRKIYYISTDDKLQNVYWNNGWHTGGLDNGRDVTNKMKLSKKTNRIYYITPEGKFSYFVWVNNSWKSINPNYNDINLLEGSIAFDENETRIFCKSRGSQLMLLF